MISEEFRSFPVLENDLTDAQRTAVAMLAMGKSFKFVADELGVDPRTIYNWRQQQTFQEALRERREEAWCGASDRLRAMLDQSLDVLAENLAARFDESRFRAASTILRISGLRRAVDPTPAKAKSCR
ncbi:hypothetical protein BH09PLA1_BH09PLA1_05320 [soil metagenome]